MNLFYAADITSNTYTLSEEESKHCVRVLRLTNNDEIHLVDGKGNFYTGKILDANAKKCTIEIIKTIKEYSKRDNYLHIAIAPTKNIERFEWFLEKATEIGIDEITPIICQRSERTTVKTERLYKVMIAAMKQSVKAYLPILNEPIKFNVLVQKNSNYSKFIMHCNQTQSNAINHFKNSYQSKQHAIVLIGPEGDFTTEEIALAIKNNYQEAGLGKNRLRTETAGIYTCSIFNSVNEM